MRTSATTLPQTKMGLLILMAAFCYAGCAKIGDPQPPEVQIPAPATDLALRQLSDSIVLTVSKPERNTNGSAATTFKSVEVFRLIAEDGGNAAGSIPDEEFIKQAVRVLSIPDSRFAEYLRDKTFVFQDRFPNTPHAMYSHTLWYAVLYANKKNQSAGLGKRVSIKPIPIPPPPNGLTAEGRQNYIQLRWTPPAENMDGSLPPRIAGYNIYRTEEAGKFPPTPMNPSPIQAPEFQDPDFRFGATYFYSITTVGSSQQPYPESLSSNAVSISTKDIFPPEPPAEFSAIFQGEEVVLLWTPSPSADVAGYRIYRQEKGSTDRQLVHADLIRSLSFRDTRVARGKKYEYEIVALDIEGNTSQPVKAESEQR
jgi:hypothetical protein